MNSVLILIAKAPRAGVSKTRLRLGGDDTVRVAGAFLRDTAAAMREVAGVERMIGYAPADARTYFGELDPKARLAAQPEAEFGERLIAAFEAAFATGADRVVALGSDTPHLSPTTIESAFAALDEAEVVLGPCEDGGYYLIGLRAPNPRLFRDIDWSTERVRAQTLQCARQLGLSVTELPTEFDIDQPADLARLRMMLAQKGARPCPHTRDALDALPTSTWEADARD